MNKYAALILIFAFAVSNIISIERATAETSIPKPSVPVFTVKFTDLSYVTPTTYSIDPYTRENITHYGIYVANKTIELRIKNQAFTSYYDEALGWNISLYYNVRAKIRSEENWRQLYTNDTLPMMSISNETVFSYSSQQPDNENEYIMGTYMVEFTPGSQVDFLVKAMIGYVHRVPSPVALYPYVFTGEESGWSTMQTLIIPTNFALLSPSDATYASSDVPLTFEMNLPFQEAKYSLDQNNNLTLDANTTLTGLSNGLHTVTVYANNVIDNSETSLTVAFTVEKPGPFPWLPIAVLSVAVAAVVAVAAITYLKKRRR